jgi:hypothetical protein
MGVLRSQVENTLSATLPAEIIQHLLDDYQHIKQQFFLKKFQPSELNAARFGECVLRLVEFVDTGGYTPFGKQLGTDGIINKVANNIGLPDGIRFLIPRLVRVLLDIRNKRNVAHAGGEVDPNYSDSLIVSHCADWILIEIVRNYHTNSIDEARKIVSNINEIKIPVIAEIEGFVRIQNTNLDTVHKTLILMYYKIPAKISDRDLIKWIEYKNSSRYKIQILAKLHNDALIHYENGYCTILPKGIYYVEKNISFDLLN